MNSVIPPVVKDVDASLRIRRDPEAFLEECAAMYGSVFTVPVDGGRRITYVLDPHVFQTLLSARQVDFSPVSRQSKLRFGLGRVVATHEDVRELSATLTKSLRGTNLAETLVRFEDGLERAIQTYRTNLPGEGGRDTIQHLTHHTLIPASVYALFGSGVYDEAFIADFFTFSSAVSTRFAGSNPELNADGVEAERRLMARLAGALEHQASPVVQTMSNTLLRHKSLTQDERLRTLLMLMWGSMVNLVPTSVWMFASVMRDPALVDELRREASPHLRRSIVMETLRLFSRPNMYREISEDFELTLSDGRTMAFQRGDWLALFPRFLHHDPAVFHDARRFEPRRFCPASAHTDAPPSFYKDGKPLKHATVVFGLGRGRCPGDVYSAAVLDQLLKRWLVAFDAQPVTSELPASIHDTVSSTPGPTRAIEIWIHAREEGGVA
jgi:cytochrome P450